MISDTLVAALPGAIATVAAGVIGAYAVLKRDSGDSSTDIPDASATVANRQFRIRRQLRRSAWIIAGISIALGVGVVLLAYHAGAQRNLEVEEATLDQQLISESASYKELIRQGVAAKKAYILPSIVMLVTVEKSSDGLHVIEDQRTTYQVHALTNISADDKTQWNLFKEAYSSRHLDTMRRIPGSDREEAPNPEFDNQEWVVRFNDKDGERQTIMTGVEHTRPFIEKVAKGLCMFPEISSGEDCFCYPNADDVIGELMIIVQSRSLNLNVSGAATAAIKRSNGEIEPVDVTHWDLGNGQSIPSTVVARFSSVNRGDYVGVKVRWADE